LTISSFQNIEDYFNANSKLENAELFENNTPLSDSELSENFFSKTREDPKELSNLINKNFDRINIFISNNKKLEQCLFSPPSSDRKLSSAEKKIASGKLDSNQTFLSKSCIFTQQKGCFSETREFKISILYSYKGRRY